MWPLNQSVSEEDRGIMPTRQAFTIKTWPLMPIPISNYQDLVKLSKLSVTRVGYQEKGDI